MVRLYLNDQLIEEKPVEEMKAVFSLAYTPGVLKAEGIRNGKVMETQVLHTAGKPAALRLTVDRSELDADGQDLSFIVIEAIDAEGQSVPVADNQLEVSVKGAATLLALGNADIKDEDPYFDFTHHLWKGRALLVVRSNGKRGKASVQVSVKDINGKDVKKNLSLLFR